MSLLTEGLTVLERVNELLIRLREAQVHSRSDLANDCDELAQICQKLYREANDVARRYEDLVHGLDAIVWEGLPETFQFLFVSDQGPAILGYSKEEFLSPGFWESHLHPDDRKVTVARCHEATRAGEGHKIEYRFIAKDGRIVWISDTVGVLRDEQGQVKLTRGVMVDVTERKRAEEAASALRTEIVAARKLDELKSQFLNMVTHELRTPLTTIKGFVEFLEEGIAGPLTPQQSEYIAQIRGADERLERLVDDLLDFARMDAGTFRLRLTRCNLVERLQEVVDGQRPQAEHAGVRLVAELPEEPLVATFDPDRVGQVLTNLVSNAIKFTPAGGRITIRAKREGDHILCEVEDNGLGIETLDIAKLFNRFTQLKEGQERGGTGLGLAISKALIEAHGGQIGVRSLGHGHGSTFWFTLPATDSSS